MNKRIRSQYIDTTKGSRMIMRTSLAALLAVVIAAMASTASDGLSQIQAQMNSVLNKAGIDFSGTFKSQFLSSTLDEASGDSAVDWGNNRTETNEFTSVDFDIKARPNEALSGRLIFRMHQNWQNFFSDVANPIFTRWISIDANIRRMYRFNVGDFRQHYSPLTLWSPDIEVDFEPQIFAMKRHDAEKEVFIGNNDRLLQGVNFNLDAELYPIFNELHVNVMGARLRCAGTQYINGSAIADNIEDADMDRILTGVNVDILMLKGLGFGVSVLNLFDLTATYDGSVHKGNLLARKGMISAFRLKPGTSIFMESSRFRAGLDIEAAVSNNRDSAWYAISAATTDTTVMDTSFGLGMALNIDLKGRVTLGTYGAFDLKVGFMSNDSLFRNEMAQSPTFLGQRIMNVENDENSGMLYTTFDALYNHVFKFAPNNKNQWSKVPRRKISYVTAIVSPEELDSMDAKGASFFVNGDPALQTVLPYGPATPNRVGPKGALSLSLFKGGIDANINGALLSEIKPQAGMEKARFLCFGVGCCVDIATWVSILNSCKLGIGYRIENSAQKDIAQNLDRTSKNSFVNAGLSYNIWQRFSLLAGYQSIAGTAEFTEKEKITQTQWALGLEYRVSETNSVVGRIGNISCTHDELWKDNDFSASQVDLFMNVDF